MKLIKSLFLLILIFTVCKNNPTNDWEQRIVYQNSFEKAEDIIGWRWMSDENLVNEPAPNCGNKSLLVNGRRRTSATAFKLHSLEGSCNLKLCFWAKLNENSLKGTIYLRLINEDNIPEERMVDYISAEIDKYEWHFYETSESLFCPENGTLKIELRQNTGFDERSSLNLDYLFIMKE